jgi:DNA invertase Pin-like site-specific DNA recombinase
VSNPDPHSSAGGRKGPGTVAGVAGAAKTRGTRSDPNRDALQQLLATQRADCDALLGAVVDRLRLSVVTPPGLAQAPGESLAATRATVLQCADDLAHVRDLLAPR